MKQNLIDVAEFEVIAGSGGKGVVNFRREKYEPRGGPDGGEGGQGGSVILRANANINTLRFFAGKDRFEADRGLSGGRRKSNGEDGEDLIIDVPVGTVVKIDPINHQLLTGRRFHGEGAEELKHSGMKLDKVPYVGFEERWGFDEGDLSTFENQTDSRGARDDTSDLNSMSDVSKNKIEWVEVADLDESGMELVVARGGRGGKGNFVYRSSELTTPKFAQTGERGESFRIQLELKVLADVGLVGLPNAGKSTLLSVLTAAKPEIADYPFTTLSPNLGVLEQEKQGMGAGDLVIADIPGLIEDAHEGKGLGDEFLKHVERCNLLLYVVSTTEEMLLEYEDDSEKIATAIWKQFEVVKKEVESYGNELIKKNYLVVVNKIDLIYEFRTKIQEYFEKKGEKVLLISAATTEGMEDLKDKLFKQFE